MTNDGMLANALMKASSNVPKVYVVKVAGQPDEAKLDKLRCGVSIAEKGGRRVRTAPAKIRLIREGDNPWLEVTIIEGRNRQVRKMFEEVGHHVEKIRRVQYGPLALDVPPGDWRNLTLLEVAKLKTAASGVKVASPPSPEISLRPAKALAIKRTSPQKFAHASRSTKPAYSDKPVFTQRSSGLSHSGKPLFGPRSPRPARSGKPSFAPRSPRPPELVGRDKPSFASRSPRPRSPRPPQSGKPSFGGAQSSQSLESGKTPFASRSSRPPRSMKATRMAKGSTSRPFRPSKRKRD